jgi:DnaJ-class molecular chaperone
MKLSQITEAKYFRLDDPVECPDCDGRGWVVVMVTDEAEKDFCWTCNSEGTITQQRYDKIQHRREQLRKQGNW